MVRTSHHSPYIYSVTCDCLTHYHTLLCGWIEHCTTFITLYTVQHASHCFWTCELNSYVLRPSLLCWWDSVLSIYCKNKSFERPNICIYSPWVSRPCRFSRLTWDSHDVDLWWELVLSAFQKKSDLEIEEIWILNLIWICLFC